MGYRTINPPPIKGVEVSKKDLDDLVAKVRKRGYPVVTGGSGHRKVLDPTTGRTLVSISVSPSSSHAYDNTVRDLKRAGVLEQDPKRDGQMATPKEDLSIDDYQRDMSRMVERVLEAGVTRQEFISHLFDLTNATPNTRHYKTRGGAEWAVATLLRNDGSLTAWSLENIERAANDLLGTPVPIHVVEPIVEPVDSPIEKPEINKDHARLRAALEQIARDIQTGMDLEMRKGRSWGHGIWRLMGEIALRSGKRHGIDTKPKRGKGGASHAALLGNKMRGIILGDGSTSRTIELAKHTVADWAEGYRLRPTDMVEHPTGAHGEIPQDLLDVSWEEPTPEPLIVVVPVYEDIDVGEIVGDTEPEPIVIEAEPDEWNLVPEPVKPLVIGATTVPSAWEDGAMPLHLRMIAPHMKSEGMDADLVAEILEIAREVMLSELRETD